MKVHAHDHFNNSGLCAPDGLRVTICGQILGLAHSASWDQREYHWSRTLTCKVCRKMLARVPMWKRVNGGPVK